MIRTSIFFIAIISLIYGSVFLFNPIWFIDLSEAEHINIAWLRNIGASIVGLLFFGCLSIYYKPKGKLSLFKIITITSTLQTIALIFSRFYNEFSAQNLIIVDLSIYLAVFVCIYFIYIIYFKSGEFR
tara:strand:- start:467 stop:850 length:384 start_codon:yes stop_codon:yes gene_type:complete